MICSLTALSSFRAGAPVQHRPAARNAPRRPQLTAPRAVLEPVQIMQLADAAPGSVDAPVGAIVIGAIVVTALSFAVSAGLKPGTDAANQMQKRDAKKFNKYDK